MLDYQDFDESESIETINEIFVNRVKWLMGTKINTLESSAFPTFYRNTQNNHKKVVFAFVSKINGLCAFFSM